MLPRRFIQIVVLAISLMSVLARSSAAGIAWADSSGKIYTSNSEASSFRVLTTSAGAVTGMAFDQITQRLYYASGSSVYWLDGSDQALDFQTPTLATTFAGESLSNLIVDPKRRRLLVLTRGATCGSQVYAVNHGIRTMSFEDGSVGSISLPTDSVPGSPNCQLIDYGAMAFDAIRDTLYFSWHYCWCGPGTLRSDEPLAPIAVAIQDPFSPGEHTYLAKRSLGGGDWARLNMDPPVRAWRLFALPSTGLVYLDNGIALLEVGGASSLPKAVAGTFRQGGAVTLSVDPVGDRVLVAGRSVSGNEPLVIHSLTNTGWQREVVPTAVAPVSACFTGGGAEVVDASDAAVLPAIHPEPLSDPLSPSKTAQTLWSSGRTISGLTADGAARLLIRTRTYQQPGRVLFYLSDVSDPNADEWAGQGNGHLYDPITESPQSPSEQPVLLSVNTTANPLAPDEHRAFAVLRAPEDFVRAAFRAEDAERGWNNPRKLRIRTEFYPTGSAVPLDNSVQSLDLVRPLVVLVHGVFDKPSSWQWMFDDRFLVARIGYESTNGKDFRTNVQVIRARLHEIQEGMAQQRVASKRVDFIGHSMGGVLGRLFAMDSVQWPDATSVENFAYRRPDNFMRGDINRLITVNSPHRGSQIPATIVTRENSALGFAEYAEAATRRFFGDAAVDACDWPKPDPRDTFGGALADLRPDGRGTMALNSRANPLPVYAIVGVGDADGSSDCYAERTRRTLSIGCLKLPSEFFRGANDAVVPKLSQTGGLSDSHVFEALGDGALHWPIIAVPGPVLSVVVDHVQEILTARIEDGDFDLNGFPPMSGVPLPDCNPGVIQQLTLGTVWWDQEVLNGNVPVTKDEVLDAAVNLILRVATPLQRNAGVTTTPTLASVTAIASDGQIFSANGTNVAIPIRISRNYVGPYDITLITTDTNGNRYSTEPIQFQVRNPTSLVSIAAAPSAISLGANAPTDQARILGTYANGVVANLSSSAVGTSYAVSDNSIADIGPDGLIKAKRVGTATITATNSGLIAITTVQVTSVRGDSDGNGELDRADVRTFEAIYSGPREAAGYRRPAQTDLDTFDYDRDGDIDCDDFDAFRAAYRLTMPIDPISERCSGRKTAMDIFDTSSLPGSTGSVRYILGGMSRNGLVLFGNYERTVPGSTVKLLRPWRWSKDTGIVALPTDLGLWYYDAAGISDDGSVIVGTGPGGGGRWIGLSSFLPMPGIAAGMKPVGISGDGGTVIGDFRDENRYTSAAKWSAGGGFVRLFEPHSGVLESLAAQVSARGEVVLSLAYDPALDSEARVYRISTSTDVPPIRVSPPVSVPMLTDSDPTGVMSSDGLLLMVLQNGVDEKNVDQTVISTWYNGAWTEQVWLNGYRVEALANQTDPSRIICHEGYRGGRVVLLNGQMIGVGEYVAITTGHDLDLSLPLPSVISNDGLSVAGGGTDALGRNVAWRLRSEPRLACAADMTQDGLVDDSDFSVFVAAYNEVLCPFGPGCLGDFNRDGVVDDSDFSLFAVAYDQLLCPE